MIILKRHLADGLNLKGDCINLIGLVEYRYNKMPRNLVLVHDIGRNIYVLAHFDNACQCLNFTQEAGRTKAWQLFLEEVNKYQVAISYEEREAIFR